MTNTTEPIVITSTNTFFREKNPKLGRVAKCITQCELSNGMTLEITTKKDGDALRTIASVAKRDGLFTVFRMYVDFWRTIAIIPCKQATEKRIADAHHAVIDDQELMNDLVLFIDAHYIALAESTLHVENKS